AGDPVVLSRTLELGSNGAVRTYPNPFVAGAGAGLAIEFMVTQMGQASAEALTLDLRDMFHERYTNYPASTLFHSHRLATDDHLVPLPPGLFWIHVAHDGTEGSNLVILDH